MISIHFQGKLFNITVIQIYTLTSNVEESEPPRLSRTTTPKRCPFHYWGLECKIGSQDTLGVTGNLALKNRMKQSKA